MFRKEFMSWFTSFVLFHIFTSIRAEEFARFRTANHDLTEFLKILNSSPFMVSSMAWKSGTLLAPTNEAIRNYKFIHKLDFTNQTLLYHYANVPRMLNELAVDDSINSELPANPPVWITKKNSDIYLNDAKITRGNLKLKMGEEQVVHVIDKVLEPTLPTDRQPNLDSPTARKYLENSAKYGLGSNLQTTKFSNQVSRTMKADRTTGLLDSIGKRTYFIPVDDAFKNNNNLRNVDEKTIDGHIIPDRAVFLSTADIGQRMETYKTTDFASNFPVFISFGKEMVDGKEVWLVKSDNREGDTDHVKGVVQAQVVKANIPVKNGVIHLISKPLVLIDTTIYQTLRLYANEQPKTMGEFFNLIEKQTRKFEFKNLLDGQPNKRLTLFVPSNKAISQSTELSSMLHNSAAMADLINLHILLEAVPAAKIIEKNKIVGGPRSPYQVASNLADRKLFFNVVGGEGNRTLFVEGGGVNATIIQPDFGATNGFIHIIDKVLGIPNHNMEEKLKSHPLLQMTYQLWIKEKFDERLNSSLEPYIFFAPSEAAWRNLQFKSEAAHHNILYGSLGALPSQLLERHLMIKQKDFDSSIQRLSEISKNHFSLILRERESKDKNKEGRTDIKVNYPLMSMNGYLKVMENVTTLKDKQQTGTNQKKEEPQFYVGWKHITAHVVRANVKCTNGIIHIIDTVLMEESEVTVAFAPTQFQPGKLSLAASVITFFLVSFM